MKSEVKTKKYKDRYIKMNLKRFVLYVLISGMFWVPVTTKGWIMYPTLMIETNANIFKLAGGVCIGAGKVGYQLWRLVPKDVKKPVNMVMKPIKNLSQVAGVKPVALKHKIISPVRLFDLVNPFKWFVR